MTAGLHVAFVGIDGSGKSTQAGLLTKRLNDDGYVAYLFEGKEDFAVQVMRTAAAAHHQSPRSYFGNDGVDLAKAFDTLRDQVHLVQPLKARGAIVVAPRSGYDRVALAQAMGSKNVPQVEVITHFAGVPDVAIRLDVPTDVAHRRIVSRGIDTEDPDLLERFRRALDVLGTRISWITIDGAAPIEIVHQQIWTELSRKLTEAGRSLLRLRSRAQQDG